MTYQPPIFLINLDESTDRLKAAYDRLAPFNLEITRISAVMGKYLDQNTKDKYYCPEKNKRDYHKG